MTGLGATLAGIMSHVKTYAGLHTVIVALALHVGIAWMTLGTAGHASTSWRRRTGLLKSLAGFGATQAGIMSRGKKQTALHTVMVALSLDVGIAWMTLGIAGHA